MTTDSSPAHHHTNPKPSGSELFLPSLCALADAMRGQDRYRDLAGRYPDATQDAQFLGAYVLERAIFRQPQLKDDPRLSFLTSEGLNPEDFSNLPHPLRQAIMDALHEIGIETLWQQPEEQQAKQDFLNAAFQTAAPNPITRAYLGKSNRDVLIENICATHPLPPLLHKLGAERRTAIWQAKMALAGDDVNRAYGEGAELLKNALESTITLSDDQQQALLALTRAERRFARAQRALSVETPNDSDKRYIAENERLKGEIIEFIGTDLTNHVMHQAPKWMRELVIQSAYSLQMDELFRHPSTEQSREVTLAAPLQNEKWHLILSLENAAYGCGLNANDLALQTTLNRQLSTHPRGEGNPEMGSINRFAHNPAIHSRHVVSLGYDLFMRAIQAVDEQFAVKYAQEGANIPALQKECEHLKVKLRSNLRAFMRTAGKHDMGELLGELSVAGTRIHFTGAALEAMEKKRGEMEGNIYSEELMWHIRLLALKESGAFAGGKQDHGQDPASLPGQDPAVMAEEKRKSDAIAEEVLQHHIRHAPDLLKLRQIHLDVATLQEQIGYIRETIRHDAAMEASTAHDSSASSGMLQQLWHGLRKNLGHHLRALSDLLLHETAHQAKPDDSLRQLETQLRHLEAERKALSDKMVPYPTPDSDKMVPLNYTNSLLETLYTDKRFNLYSGDNPNYQDRTVSEIYGELLSKYGKYSNDFQSAEASDTFFGRLHKLIERSQSQEDYDRFDMTAGGRPLYYPPSEVDADGNIHWKLNYFQWKLNYVWSVFAGDKKQATLRQSLHELMQVGDQEVQEAVYEAALPWVNEIMHRVIDDLAYSFQYKGNGVRFPGAPDSHPANLTNLLGEPKMVGEDFFWAITKEKAHTMLHREFRFDSQLPGSAALSTRQQQGLVSKAA